MRSVRGRTSSSRPPKASSASLSIPRARSTRTPVSLLAARASASRRRVVFPVPADPIRASAPLSPAAAREMSPPMAATSASLPSGVAPA